METPTKTSILKRSQIIQSYDTCVDHEVICDFYKDGGMHVHMKVHAATCTNGTMTATTHYWSVEPQDLRNFAKAYTELAEELEAVQKANQLLASK